MKSQLKSTKRSSKTAAPSQLKTSQIRFPLPSLALFPVSDEGGAEESIDLSVAEYTALKWAADDPSDVLTFMVKAALEKASAAQRVQDIRKLVIWKDTWAISTKANAALHRTLSGQLLIVNKTPADVSGNQHFSNPRWVSYSEACEWLRNGGNRWKPEVILQFHGIQASAADVAAAAHRSAAAKTQAA
jgi:hypothetical protein